MTIDPQVQVLLDALEQFGLPDFSDLEPEQARALYGTPADPDTIPHVDHVEDRSVPGPAGDIAVRVYRHGDATDQPLVVFFHGGGWVIGDLDSHDRVCRLTCLDAGVVVVAVHYRRAPEDPYPAATDDSVAAMKWAIEHAAELGADGSRVAVMGDSAGGNLAAVAALEARDAGIELRHQALVYPVTDAEFDRPSYLRNAEGKLLTRAAMRWFWDAYVPDLDEREQWRVAPIYADLAGVCPATVITAEYDPLCDEGEDYVAALRSAGVEVHHERYDGMIHAFYGRDLEIDMARTAQLSIAGALKQALR